MGPFYTKNTKSRSVQIIIALLFIGLGLYVLFSNSYIKSASLEVPSQEAPQIPLQRSSVPTHLTIADSIDLPVEEMQFGPKGWNVSDNAASIASTSARPGEKGNIVIYSHNKQKLFGKLHQAKEGDKITLTTQDGKEHGYSVVSRTIVSPDQVDLLRSTSEEVLTLYTCTGFLDSKRLVIRGKPL